MLTGNITNGYGETNFNRINNISYNQYEFFVQDSWKATKRLTVEFGLRLSHFSPWTDREGFGYSIFNPAQYGPACCTACWILWLRWRTQGQGGPVGGFPTRAFYFNRVWARL